MSIFRDSLGNISFCSMTVIMYLDLNLLRSHTSPRTRIQTQYLKNICSRYFCSNCKGRGFKWEAIHLSQTLACIKSKLELVIFSLLTQASQKKFYLTINQISIYDMYNFYNQKNYHSSNWWELRGRYFFIEKEKYLHLLRSKLSSFSGRTKYWLKIGTYFMKKNPTNIVGLLVCVSVQRLVPLSLSF